MTPSSIMRANSGGRVVAADPTRTRKSRETQADHEKWVQVCLFSCIDAWRRLQPRGNVMTRIHEAVSSGKHEQWCQFGVRCARSSQHAIWIFAVMAFLASMVM